ncbi:Light dependent period [Halomicronema hongdechloris C2206]|uniref:Light dependent period n=1 Tax=Halomicronema hongdechloris C2206 TaxID=1641165 RepID=A0A1Z3HVJ7_9CYAN|nr:LdpA C-terminal domain-containing domain [Halomicronema hongdechloris]ASC74319.1 Light dependent period [Halomicronema hongdechloris C2206]
MSTLLHPLRSLAEGHWFKLICGASYHYLPAVHDLALVYALAGADCIDVAADPAVVATVSRALQMVPQVIQQYPGHLELRSRSTPLVMVSLNDGEDPHFRKATLDATRCPEDCPRPCEHICPADAIALTQPTVEPGIVEARCYGCGRCLPVCPHALISTRADQATSAAIASTLINDIDAIEIHTQVGRDQAFQQLWESLIPRLSRLRLIAISCPGGPGVLDYLWRLYHLIQPLPVPLIWQTDGRPMSGDIGTGTTHATIHWGQQVLRHGPPGYIQLAGGTNQHTVAKLATLGLLQPMTSPSSGRAIAGVAYGSYARKLLLPLLEPPAAIPADAVATTPPPPLIARPHDLLAAVQQARNLVDSLKRAVPPPQPAVARI